MPGELGKLTALEELHLYRNKLSGETTENLLWEKMCAAYAWVSTKLHNLGTRGMSFATRLFSKAGHLNLCCPATLSSDCRFHPA